jgi:PKD repeat protein
MKRAYFTKSTNMHEQNHAPSIQALKINLPGMKKLILIPVLLLLAASCTREVPRARFTVSAQTIEAGEAVRFTNVSVNADFVEWDFDDGYISNEYDPVHVFSHPGNYRVKLTAFSSDHLSDQCIMTITVLYPTTLEITVREYYNQYAVPNASVILYPTLDDWIHQTNALIEGFTDLDGRVIFSHLAPHVYYIDVWEQNHNNYLLAEEDVGFIRTQVLVPNSVNTFTAWVDYVGGRRKNGAARAPGSNSSGRKWNP